LYSDVAALNADQNRTQGVDPSPDAGIIAEVITTGNETIPMTPGVIGFSTEDTASVNIPIRVTNNSSSSANVTVTLTLLRLEI